MSSEVPTPERGKNPNRVAQGNRLAEWNKQHRGKMKMLQEEVEILRENDRKQKEEIKMLNEKLAILKENQEEMELLGALEQDRKEIEELKKELAKRKR